MERPETGGRTMNKEQAKKILVIATPLHCPYRVPYAGNCTHENRPGEYGFGFCKEPDAKGEHYAFPKRCPLKDVEQEANDDC